MKLLILTQKIDQTDPVLGFFCRWVEEFSRHAEKITVICLEKGTYTLPHNVTVYSLGKDKKPSRLLYLWNFYRLVWLLRGEYDSVFVHMNFEYILLAGWLWRRLGKKVGLWYAHGAVPKGLRYAASSADIIFTSTKEGFRLSNEKIKVVGQGIDTNLFSPRDDKPEPHIFTIVTVGRISRVKDYELLIEAIRRIETRVVVNIIGGPITEADREYDDLLRAKIAAYHLDQRVFCLGPKTQKEIVPELQTADLFVNMSQTGSLDKAMHEAMSTCVPMLTSNEAATQVLGPYGDKLMYAKGAPADLLRKIEWVMNLSLPEREALGSALRDIVKRDHGIEKLINSIVTYYGK